LLGRQSLLTRYAGDEVILQGSEKPGFLKKPNPLGFGDFYWVLGFIGFFGFFI